MAKILMIDDDAMVLKLYTEVLSKEGFEVISSNDAREGLAMAAEQSPDLVLLDIMMPDVEGTRVHESLKLDDKTKNIPVAFLAALVTDEEVAAVDGKIGGLDYISKSTPNDKFVNQVKELLAKWRK
ncbi:MAG TPA: response regulator, partial [Candidatus Omnitrophota bacterium]|nr:response regulator [Candidatus Omnitrophota bacterium]